MFARRLASNSRNVVKAFNLTRFAPKSTLVRGYSTSIPVRNKPSSWAPLTAVGGSILLSYWGLVHLEDHSVEVQPVETVKVVETPASGESKTEESPAQETPEAKEVDFGDQHSRYIIIGGGVSAYHAIQGIRKHDPDGKILVICKEEDALYARPPLSKELWKSSPEELEQLVWTDFHGEKGQLMFDLANDPNLEVWRGQEAVDLDAYRKAVLVGSDKILTYDKCLIATGASPRTLPIVGAEDEALVAPHVTTFRSLGDFRQLLRVTEQPLERIAVVGGGVLGTELAFALAGKVTGEKVIQIFPESGPLASIVPSYLSEHIAASLSGAGTVMKPGTTVSHATPHEGKVKLELSDGTSVVVDHVVVAAGVQPNTKLARRAELEIDSSNGGVVANAELQARTDLWVAGDVASFYDIVTDKRIRVEHWDSAVFTGSIAGENMAGQRLPYLHQAFWWTDCGADMALEAVGVVDSRLETVGVFEEPEGSYKKGVVYYLSNDNERAENRVVGVLLCNFFDKVETALGLIKKGTKVKDAAELKTLIPLIDGDDDIPTETPEAAVAPTSAD